jgi:hypothetical protein
MKTSESILIKFCTSNMVKTLELSKYLIDSIESNLITKALGENLLITPLQIISSDKDQRYLHKLLSFTIKKGFKRWAKHIIENYSFDFNRKITERYSGFSEFPEKQAIILGDIDSLQLMIDAGLDLNHRILDFSLINETFNDEKVCPDMMDFIFSKGFILESLGNETLYQHKHRNIIETLFSTKEHAAVSLKHGIEAKDYLGSEPEVNDKYYINKTLSSLYHHFFCLGDPDSYAYEYAVRFLENIDLLDPNDPLDAPYFDSVILSRFLHDHLVQRYPRYRYHDEENKVALHKFLGLFEQFTSDPLIIRKSNNIMADLKSLSEGVKTKGIACYYISNLAKELVPYVNTLNQFEVIINNSSLTPLEALPLLKNNSILKSDVLRSLT